MDKKHRQKTIPTHIQQHFENHRKSGMTIKAYCSDAGISAMSFYGWRKRYEKKARSSAAAAKQRRPLQEMTFTSLGTFATQQPLFDVTISTGVRISIYPGATAQEFASFYQLISGNGSPC
jgi:hypothetical protein